MEVPVDAVRRFGHVQINIDKFQIIVFVAERAVRRKVKPDAAVHPFHIYGKAVSADAVTKADIGVGVLEHLAVKSDFIVFQIKDRPCSAIVIHLGFKTINGHIIAD